MSRNGQNVVGGGMTAEERKAIHRASALAYARAVAGGLDKPHRFEPSADPRPLGTMQRCKTCGVSAKAVWHRAVRYAERAEKAAKKCAVETPKAVADAASVVVSCPTCTGTGSVHLAVADVQALALRRIKA